MKRSCLALLIVMASGSMVFAQAPATATAPAAAPAPGTQPADAGLSPEEAKKKQEESKKRLDELKAKAQGGDAEAMVTYGLVLVSTSGGNAADLKTSAEWFKKAADKGSASGMYCYGRALMMGAATGKPEPDAGLDWIIKAAKAGDAKACLMLFENNLSNAKTPQQINLTMELGTAAVKAGSKEAMVKLGMVYLNGQIIKQDPAKGIKLLEQAYDAGSPVAASFLGHIYSANFPGVPSDPSKAFAWFQKAADRNDPMGILGLAACYGQGTGVAKDVMKAVELSKRGAAMGHVPSMRQLEKIYRQGLGVEKNPTEADLWKKRAEMVEAAPGAPK